MRGWLGVRQGRFLDLLVEGGAQARVLAEVLLPRRHAGERVTNPGRVRVLAPGEPYRLTRLGDGA